MESSTGWNLSDAYINSNGNDEASTSCHCVLTGHRHSEDISYHHVPQHLVDGVGEIKDAEEFLASELSKVSIQERHKAMDDVHCVGEELQEDPSMLERGLREFQKELAELARADRIYQLAVNQNQSYIEGENFRLMFLRANMYDAKRSVRQMLNLLRYKAQYFGEDKVGREITLDDLDPDAIDFVYSGCFHMQREKDRFGRHVVYLFNHLFERPKSVESLIRGFYYLFHCILSLPGVQTQGLAGIFYDVAKRDRAGFGAQSNSRRLLEVMKFNYCIPVRFSALHACLMKDGGRSAINRAFVGILIRASPTYIAVRTRVHYGTHMELQYNLQSFGISMQSFPVDRDGKLVLAETNVWLRQHAERNHYSMPQIHIAPSFCGLVVDDPSPAFSSNSAMASNGSAGGIQPTPNDVLLGRGKGSQFFTGTIQFRAWMESYREDYEEAGRYKRQELARRIMKECDSKGIRFLKKTSDQRWDRADSVEIEEKIKQCFRTKRKSRN